MPRRPRVGEPAYFHVLNRAVRRERLFDDAPDYEAFMAAFSRAQRRVGMRVLAYCVMPNHFHLVVGPTLNPALSTFMHTLTMTHSKRWSEHHGTRGTGPVYQGRFKAFPIHDETHFVLVCRYVERNPIRAGLVPRAEQWPWSSISRDRRKRDPVVLSPWPIPKPSRWLELLNEQDTGSLKTPGVLVSKD